jgi:L-fuculose-phosphate aldolase
VPSRSNAVVQLEDTMTLPTKINDEAIIAARTKVAYFGQMLFDRNLTDSAGGNISYRVGDLVCITPTLAGQKQQWQIGADDVLVVDLEANILAGKGKLSRESKVHLSLHREYGEYGVGVIHAHPRNLMVFATMAQPMPPIMEATMKFGVTPVIDYAPAHSANLAKNIIASMRGRESRITKHAAATIAPWHGLFLMGKDLDAAFDAVERLDTNAYCTIMGRMLIGTDAQEAARIRMDDVIGNYKED